jgi:uncharacterized RDD family membrane protein YckC
MTKPRIHLARRALAALVDYFLFWAVAIGFITLQPWAHPDATGNYGTLGCLLLLPVIGLWCLYFGVVEARFGRTLGKGLFDLRVERLDGAGLRTADCLKRHVIDPLELNFLGLPAILVVMNTAQGQRLGDLFAETHVVLRPYEPKATAVA